LTVPEQIGFHIDANTCMSCKVCRISCADKNDLPVGVAWRRVSEHTGGRWVDRDGLPVPEGIFSYGVSVSCLHCAKPACVPACPEKAITKGPDGVVRIEADRCSGCRSCEDACSYGAPRFDAKAGVMTKCDLCADLRAEGSNPACVDACPMRAINVGPITELRRRYGRIDAVEPLPEPCTEPSLVITPHRHAVARPTAPETLPTSAQSPANPPHRPA
jgi:anaerobic dimethyl sulfoxide reductase subunit B (iron-sulfur subunit)